MFLQNRCKFFVAIFFISTAALAQDQYFQQEVNYKIRVNLNDKKHELSAFEEIKFLK